MDYQNLVNCYKALESTTKRLEKTEILSNFLKKIKIQELKNITHLLQGTIFPDYDERKLGISSRLILKALSNSTGTPQEKIEKEWAKKGDLGIIAESLTKTKKQTTLTTKKITTELITNNLTKLSTLEGEGTINRKIQLITELLTSSTPEQAKYITRTILSDLRIGVSYGVIRDSIAKAFDKEVKEIEQAYNVIADYGEVAVKAKNNKLKDIKLRPGTPTKVMLALLANNIEECFEALGKTLQLEYKLDGFRIIAHKYNKKISLFTRRLENVTSRFPELIDHIDKNIKGKNFIIDCEAVGFDRKTKKYLPFQSISQRIKRKHNIEQMSKQFPVELDVFDILYYNNKSLFEKPLKERRALLEKIIKQTPRKITLTKKLVTSNKSKAMKFFKQALKDGEEGVIIKKLDSKYKPGRYVGGWLKLKSILEPLDLVITKAEYGTGKRAGWITSYTLSCQHNEEFLEIGKVSTGVKEKSEGLTYKEMTKLLKPLILKQKAKELEIKPKIILEVAYEEIQKSPKYSSGFALRFPRVLRRRDIEKSLEEINDLNLIKKIYNTQKRGK